MTKNQLINAAKKKLVESSSDLIVANDVGSERYRKNPKYNQVIIVDSQKTVTTSSWTKKQKIAKFILKQIESKVK